MSCANGRLDISHRDQFVNIRASLKKRGAINFAAAFAIIRLVIIIKTER